MSSGADAVVGQSDKHTGPIRALDFNPFQVNLPSTLWISMFSWMYDINSNESLYFNFRVISLHPEPMILRFISGIWTTLAVQWLQVQKHRWVHDGHEIFDDNTPPQRKANLKLWCWQSKQEIETVIFWRKKLSLVSQAVVSYLWWEWTLVSLSVASFCVLQVLAKYSNIGVLCLGGNNDICFSQPVEDIGVVSWNRQVQHILASANPTGKAVVWDLRKNEPIIKISDHSNRVGGLNT